MDGWVYKVFNYVDMGLRSVCDVLRGIQKQGILSLGLEDITEVQH